jgi:methionyl-tRNA formyltransferase
MAVLAFRILPEAVYSISSIATFNIQGSLLPKYRGAAPINWAIINGETESGLTSFILKKKVDTGDMLLQTAIKIPDGSTAGDLHDLLMPEAAKMAIDTCNLLIDGEFQALKQDSNAATPAPKIFRESCEINWDRHALALRNFIHGISPVPGAWTNLNGKRFKILRAGYSASGTGRPGAFIIDGEKWLVQCGKGILSLIEIQGQGKKAMKASDFLKG